MAWKTTSTTPSRTRPNYENNHASPVASSSLSNRKGSVRDRWPAVPMTPEGTRKHQCADDTTKTTTNKQQKSPPAGVKDHANRAGLRETTTTTTRDWKKPCVTQSNDMATKRSPPGSLSMSNGTTTTGSVKGRWIAAVGSLEKNSNVVQSRLVDTPPPPPPRIAQKNVNCAPANDPSSAQKNPNTSFSSLEKWPPTRQVTSMSTTGEESKDMSSQSDYASSPGSWDVTKHQLTSRPLEERTQEFTIPTPAGPQYSLPKLKRKQNSKLGFYPIETASLSSSSPLPLPLPPSPRGQSVVAKNASNATVATSSSLPKPKARRYLPSQQINLSQPSACTPPSPHRVNTHSSPHTPIGTRRHLSDNPRLQSLPTTKNPTIHKNQQQQKAEMSKKQQTLSTPQEHIFKSTEQSVKASPTATGSPPNKHLLILVSKLSLSREQVVVQQKIEVIMKSQNIPYEELDGSIELNHDRRNELFQLSGMRGQYPQFFVVQDGQTLFFGDWETVDMFNENGTLHESFAAASFKAPKAKGHLPSQLKIPYHQCDNKHAAPGTTLMSQRHQSDKPIPHFLPTTKRSIVQNNLQQRQTEFPSKPCTSPPSSAYQEQVHKSTNPSAFPSPTTNGSPPNKRLLVLVSKLSLSRGQLAIQQKTEIILKSQNIPYEEIDGSIALNRDRRNELFSLSGLRGQYPQFFVVQTDQTSFFGDWETVDMHNENGTLLQAFESA